MLIAILINIFKKDENGKRKTLKSPFRKEKKGTVDDAKKPLTFYKIRKNIDDYFLLLTDYDSNLVLRSEIKSSYLSLKRVLDDVKNADKSSFLVQTLIDGKYEIAIVKNSNTIARSKTFDSLKEANEYLDILIKLIKESDVLESSFDFGSSERKFYDNEIDFIKFPYKTKIIEEDGLFYSLSYDKLKNVCLKSDSRKTKKEIKNLSKSIEKQFLSTKFRIDLELDGSYRFHILDNQGYTISKGASYNSIDEVIESIEKSIALAI